MFTAVAITLAATALGVNALPQAGPYTLTGSSTTLTYTVTQDTGANVLATKYFQYPYLPYKADTNTAGRGPQAGYNLCNSTTLGTNSQCQTGWINSIEDFCLWGASTPNSVVGDVEGDMVAFCTLPTHGARMIRPGALTGVQFTKAPGYVEVIGYIDQTALNLQANDAGGEEDPHGADNRGNPLGGLVFSTAFGNRTNATGLTGNNALFNGVQQVTQWNYFVGNGIFCYKACTPGSGSSYDLCENTYDETGCYYNMPANYDFIKGTFTQCKSDNQLEVGRYIQNGVTMTWSQGNGNPPYQPFTPSSSQCSTYTSSALYTGLAAYASGGVTSVSAPLSQPTRASAGVSAPSAAAAPQLSM